MVLLLLLWQVFNISSSSVPLWVNSFALVPSSLLLWFSEDQSPDHTAVQTCPLPQEVINTFSIHGDASVGTSIHYSCLSGWAGLREAGMLQRKKWRKWEMECEKERGSEGKAGVMSNEWQGIHFDLPADNPSIELTRSLQSNLVLTLLYTLTHLSGKDEPEWMCQPGLHTLTLWKGDSGERNNLHLYEKKMFILSKSVYKPLSCQYCTCLSCF